MDDSPPKLEQHDHATTEQHGASGRRTNARRSDRLLVLELVNDRAQADVVLTNRIPRTRDECPTTRPCGALRCPFNTAVVLGVDRPGRFRGGISATLEFIDGESNCLLDATEQGPSSFKRIAKVLGFSDPRRCQQLARKALLKLKAAGVPVDDLIALVEAEDLDDDLPTHDTRRVQGPL